MDFVIENKIYELIVASDSIRDGIGVELWDKADNKMLAEIFRNDKLKKILFFSIAGDIPYEAIEKLVKEFEEKVGREFNNS